MEPEQLGAVNFNQSPARMFQVIGSRFRLFIFRFSPSTPPILLYFLWLRHKNKLFPSFPWTVVGTAMLYWCFSATLESLRSWVQKKLGRWRGEELFPGAADSLPYTLHISFLEVLADLNEVMLDTAVLVWKLTTSDAEAGFKFEASLSFMEKSCIIAATRWSYLCQPSQNKMELPVSVSPKQLKAKRSWKLVLMHGHLALTKRVLTLVSICILFIISLQT